MRISMVVAVAENGIIGADNGLPWRLKGDMKHFKATTMGKPIIVGRKTFESFGRPLPGRKNIVLSRRDAPVPEGVALVHSLEDALVTALVEGAQEACVVGGADIYAQAMPYAHTLHFTRAHMDADGDTAFPEFDTADWTEVSAERHEAGDGDSCAYTIQRLDRNSPPPKSI
jgi:dihydrofolate reductase